MGRVSFKYTEKVKKPKEKWQALVAAWMIETRESFQIFRNPVSKNTSFDLHLHLSTKIMTDLQEQGIFRYIIWAVLLNSVWCNVHIARNELKDIEMAEDFFTDDEDMGNVDSNMAKVDINNDSAALQRLEQEQ